MSESTKVTKKRKRETTIIHGRPQKFFQEATSTFCLSFSSGWGSVFPLKIILHEQIFVLVSMIILGLSKWSFQWITKFCKLYNKYIILSKYEQNTHVIQIASCLRAFPLLWNVASAREWDITAQQFWWSWVFAPLRGNIADDALQMDVHKTLYPFYTTKKMPHVTATITKKRFAGSNSQVY